MSGAQEHNKPRERVRNRRVTDAFDTRIGYPSQDKIGDYIQSISSSAGLNLAYAATYTGGQDIYFLRVWVMDEDGDADIDLDDYVLFLPCFDGPGSGPPAAECRWTDPDGSLTTDLADVARLQRDHTGRAHP